MQNSDATFLIKSPNGSLSFTSVTICLNLDLNPNRIFLCLLGLYLKAGEGWIDGWVDENQGPGVPHTHLSCLIIIFDLAQISAAGLGDPLPRHQVPHHHRGRTDLCGSTGEYISYTNKTNRVQRAHTAFLTALILSDIRGDLAADRPGCFCRGLGRLVTQVWGHMRTLQGCREPSKNSCLVSDRWIPPRGVLGRVLAGTRAKQNTPTLWMLSIACRTRGIWLSGEVKNRLQSICEEPRRSFQPRSDAGGDLYRCLGGNQITKREFGKWWEKIPYLQD